MALRALPFVGSLSMLHSGVDLCTWHQTATIITQLADAAKHQLLQLQGTELLSRAALVMLMAQKLDRTIAVRPVSTYILRPMFCRINQLC